jgi:hypothetical protein
MIPTTEENKQRINDLVTNLEEVFSNLYSRWLDEHQYENIEEYQKVLTHHLPEGFRIDKMSKRPFGFYFNIGTEASYLFYSKSNCIGWKRIS